MYVLLNNEARSCNHCCSGKSISVTYSDYICSLRYPARNVHAPYCHIWPAPTVKHFSTLSHKRHDLKKKNNNNKIN